MYRGLTLRLLHEPDEEAVLAQARAAQDAGANLIALVPHHYVLLGNNNEVLDPPWASRRIWEDRGQAPGLTGNTTPYVLIKSLARRIRALGMQVLIKPHIDPGYLHEGVYGVGGWRYYISVKDIYHTPALFRPRLLTWAGDYRYMLSNYVRIASETHSGLCLGCELGSITREAGPEFWVDLARWVRADCRFNGLLTYAANWGEEVNRLTPLWQSPDIDFIGCDWYVPVASWVAQTQSLRALERVTHKYVLFTEVGYANRSDAQIDPPRDPHPDDTPDDNAQRMAWAIFQSEWGMRSRIAWEGPLVGMLPEPITHNVLRTPELAHQVLGDLYEP